MQQLYLSVLLIFMASVTFSQEVIYQDNKLEAHLSVQKKTDSINDVFYNYYVLNVKNTSSEEVKFIPVFKYKNNKGKVLTSESRDEQPFFTLAPGEKIEGHIKNNRSLTLFKKFTIGNSGKRASETEIMDVTVTINYQ